ncbi:HAD-IA family hydrolase [Lactococcus hircilactis]|uniref:HAD-IA family hydrolase n=1 Tax=Lactococcus hircilactis TaxID=1494462 RepID=A0A7X1Z862_9LACT|nr:HAD family phosphatase [Lactococcus hircilactis]MQW39613.1 HAD-IA family hydrolase [Lactococcus hircilactis]
MTIKNIIFDLGGVVIDLKINEMTSRFEALGIKNFSSYFNFNSQSDLFLNLELGKITPEAFYDGFRQTTQTNLTNEEIKSAWNLILAPYNLRRMALIERLSKTYSLYLFSNTNAIHAASFEQSCLDQTQKPLSAYFTTCFYSHDLGMRKPETEAFLGVLEKAHLKADETLFIDDNAANIEGAKKVGLQTYLLTHETLLDLDFSQIINSK